MCFKPPTAVFLIELVQHAGPLCPRHAGLDPGNRSLGARQDRGMVGQSGTERAGSHWDVATVSPCRSDHGPGLDRLAPPCGFGTLRIRRDTKPAVPVSAHGGGTDVAARIVGEHMARTLGQQIIIQNVPGAGGTVGSTRAMRADPDGYTILMGQMGTHATAPALYPNLAYKPEIDFEPVGMVSEIPLMLVARKDFPPNNLGEFVAFVKRNADKLNVGHAGVGSIFFSTSLLLNSILNVKPTLVPFGGGAPAMSALVAGQVDYECGDVVTAAPQLKAGTIKAYAIASAARNAAVPTVPTTSEAGLPEFQASGWFALFAPKATPKPILDKLTGALERFLSSTRNAC